MAANPEDVKPSCNTQEDPGLTQPLRHVDGVPYVCCTLAEAIRMLDEDTELKPVVFVTNERSNESDLELSETQEIPKVEEKLNFEIDSGIEQEGSSSRNESPHIQRGSGAKFTSGSGSHSETQDLKSDKRYRSPSASSESSAITNSSSIAASNRSFPPVSLKRRVRKSKPIRQSDSSSSCTEASVPLPGKRRKLTKNVRSSKSAKKATGNEEVTVTSVNTVPKSFPSFDDVFVSQKKDFVSDFDLMLARKKAQRHERPKRDSKELVNYNDSHIQSLLCEMRAAAAADRELHRNGSPATKKITLFPRAFSQLVKHDLRVPFMEQDVLSVLTEWLTPMEDRSLPALKIRESILKLLTQYPNLDPSQLKASGLGRAVMGLYKHPRETESNKLVEQKLISDWARPLFNFSSDHKSMSKEERAKWDMELLPKRIQSQRKQEATSKLRNRDEEINRARREGRGLTRPGDPGWVPRAVVPSPAGKDFVARPEWDSKADISKPSPKRVTKLDKHIRSFTWNRRMSKTQHAVSLSIDGRKKM